MIKARKSRTPKPGVNRLRICLLWKGFEIEGEGSFLPVAGALAVTFLLLLWITFYAFFTAPTVTDPLSKMEHPVTGTPVTGLSGARASMRPAAARP